MGFQSAYEAPCINLHGCSCSVQKAAVRSYPSCYCQAFSVDKYRVWMLSLWHQLRKKRKYKMFPPTPPCIFQKNRSSQCLFCLAVSSPMIWGRWAGLRTLSVKKILHKSNCGISYNLMMNILPLLVIIMGIQHTVWGCFPEGRHNYHVKSLSPDITLKSLVLIISHTWYI